MKKVIFIWIPKNAGTSIYNAMIPHGMRKLKLPEEYSKFDNKGMVTFGHVSISYLLDKGYISNEFFKDAIIFGFVRNPWDRFISLFKYFKKHNIIIPQNMTFREFCYRVHDKSIESVGSWNRNGYSQCNNQVDWLFDNKDRLLADYIGRFENLQEDLDRVTDYLGIERTTIPKLNHIEQTYDSEYTEETKQLVAEIYSKDIEKFKYTFNNGIREIQTARSLSLGRV